MVNSYVCACDNGKRGEQCDKGGVCFNLTEETEGKTINLSYMWLILFTYVLGVGFCKAVRISSYRYVWHSDIISCFFKDNSR